MNFAVRLGVSPSTTTPTDFFSGGLEALFPNTVTLGLSWFPVVPPGLFAHKCGTTQSTSCRLAWSSSHCLAKSPLLSTWLPIFVPPTSLGECFFFNSLVVGLQYSSIFCQSGDFFVFKFVVVFSVVQAHAWVAGQVPSRGRARGNHTLIFLSLCFSFLSPVSKNK